MITRDNRGRYIAVRDYNNLTAVLLVKAWFKIVTLAALLAGYGLSASASELDIIDQVALREEVKLVKAHMVSPDGTYTYGKRAVRYIDGSQPAINIAYVQLPKKPVFGQLGSSQERTK